MWERCALLRLLGESQDDMQSRPQVEGLTRHLVTNLQAADAGSSSSSTASTMSRQQYKEWLQSRREELGNARKLKSVKEEEDDAEEVFSSSLTRQQWKEHQEWRQQGPGAVPECGEEESAGKQQGEEESAVNRRNKGKPRRFCDDNCMGETAEEERMRQRAFREEKERQKTRKEIQRGLQVAAREEAIREACEAPRYRETWGERYRRETCEELIRRMRERCNDEAEEEASSEWPTEEGRESGEEEIGPGNAAGLAVEESEVAVEIDSSEEEAEDSYQFTPKSGQGADTVHCPRDRRK